MCSSVQTDRHCDDTIKIQALNELILLQLSVMGYDIQHSLNGHEPLHSGF